MATGKGEGDRLVLSTLGLQRNTSKNFFYLNGDLHKKIKTNRPANLLYAWNYPKGELMTYINSDVKKLRMRAYTSGQVGGLLNRKRLQLYRHMSEDNIPKPQRSYTLDEERKPLWWFWSEDDVMKIHDFLITLHHGYPRNDGLVTPLAMPSKTEVKAVMRNDEMLYIKNKDGQMVPVWSEVEWE